MRSKGDRQEKNRDTDNIISNSKSTKAKTGTDCLFLEVIRHQV